MKSSHYTVAAILIALLSGLVLSTGFFGNPAVAQTNSAARAGQYQISAYAGPMNTEFGHGCYVLDTATGEVWHLRLGGVAEKVSDKLP